MGRYIRGQPKPFALSVVGATVFALSAVGTTVVLGRVTDTLIIPSFEEGGAPRSALVGSVVALLCVTLLRAISIVLRRYFGAMTGRRTQAGLRRGVADRYLHVPMTYHHRTPAGQLLAHADADIEAATEVIYPLPFSLGVIMLIVFSLISLLRVDPVLTLVAIVLFPALAVVNRVYTSRVEGPAERVQHQVGRVATVAHESIDGAMVVKALGQRGRRGRAPRHRGRSPPPGTHRCRPPARHLRTGDRRLPEPRDRRLAGGGRLADLARPHHAR